MIIIPWVEGRQATLSLEAIYRIGAGATTITTTITTTTTTIVIIIIIRS